LFALIWEWLSLAIGGLALFAFWAVKGDAVKHAARDLTEEARKVSQAEIYRGIILSERSGFCVFREE
jgi:hypothetical protein